MRIHLLSDLHLEFEAFHPPTTDADLVILAGDTHNGLNGITWALETFQTPVLYVMGNHEYYGHAIPNLLEKAKDLTYGTHVHILENDLYETDDAVFLGCTFWTDFNLFGYPASSGIDARQSMSDFHRIRIAPVYRKLTPGDTIDFHQASLHWLNLALSAYPDKKKVIITHHAPSRGSLAPEYATSPISPAFVSDLGDYVAESKATLWIHGHTHTVFDYLQGETRVICNPRGYPNEVSNFESGKIVKL